MQLTFGLVTLTALLDSINPCAISVLLLTIGFLINLGKVRSYILKIGLSYTFAIYLTYLAIGLGVLRALSVFGFPHVLAQIGAFILALTAIINLLGLAFKKFPIRLKMPDASHSILAKYIHQATLPSAIILGILVGLFEFPCTGGPYLTILSLLHDRATFLQGLGYLSYYNLIFVSPLLILLIVASQPGLLAKVNDFKKQHTKTADLISSILMLLLATVIWMTS